MQPRRLARSNNLAEIAELAAKHMTVQEQQGRKRLILRRGADFLNYCKMCQKCVHLRFGHFRRTSNIVKMNISLDPMAICLLCPAAVAARPKSFTQTV